VYQAAFPDHFEAFADLATMEGEVVLADLEEAGTRPKGGALHPADLRLWNKCSCVGTPTKKVILGHHNGSPIVN
jgi:hypothetical protein